MPEALSLRGPVYTFSVYGIHEAKQLGIIDSEKVQGTHAPVTDIYEHGDGKMLFDFVANCPDAVLVRSGRYQIVVYRPKGVVKDANVPIGVMPEDAVDFKPKFLEWSEEREDNDEENDPKNGKRLYSRGFTRSSEGWSEHRSPNFGKYCEGAEGIPINGGSYDDVTKACNKALEDRGQSSHSFLDNNFLFEKQSSSHAIPTNIFADEREFEGTVKWARRLREESPNEFSAMLIADNLGIDVWNARRVYDAVCREEIE